MAKPSKIIHVMPNPYGVLDASGHLAGICQMAEERAGAAAPSNLKVGASLELLGHNDRSEDLADAVNSGKMFSPVIPAVYSRSEYRARFHAAEPVAIPVSGILESFYVARARRNGTPPCILLCAGPDDLQLEALAGERLDAIERHVAAYGAEPPVADWAAQFPLDADVAELMPLVAQKRAAEAAKAAAEARAASAAGAAAAKAAADKRATAKSAAIAAAKASLGAPALAKPAPAKPAAPSEK